MSKLVYTEIAKATRHCHSNGCEIVKGQKVIVVEVPTNASIARKINICGNCGMLMASEALAEPIPPKVRPPTLAEQDLLKKYRVPVERCTCSSCDEGVDECPYAYDPGNVDGNCMRS